VRRVIVLGGLGLFGRSAADELRKSGVDVKIASRRGAADLKIDADDRDSIRAALVRGDVVVDAAGPFQQRSMSLIESAIEVGFDVIDLNDSLGYAESILAKKQQIADAGIRVLSSASSVSAVTATIVAHSGIAEPRRVTAFLAPASRHTANPGTALSLIRTVGEPVRVFRDGQLQSRVGWSQFQSFRMPEPIGTIHCGLFESADSMYLPQIWPTLRDVSMYVDTNTAGMNGLLRLATRSATVRKLMELGVNAGTAIARRIGSTAGGIGYKIEDAAGASVCYAIFAKENSYLTAVAPAVLAARAIARDEFPDRGLVLPDRHARPAELFEFLEHAGISVLRL